MAAEFGPILGSLSADCPKYALPDCYVPCLHEQAAIDYAMSPVVAHDELLTDLVKAQLLGQANFLHSLCQWTPSKCQIGEWLGFLCVQCGMVCKKGYRVDAATEIIDCGSESIEVVDYLYSSDDPTSVGPIFWVVYPEVCNLAFYCSFAIGFGGVSVANEAKAGFSGLGVEC